MRCRFYKVEEQQDVVGSVSGDGTVMRASTVAERGTAAHRPLSASEDIGTRDFPADPPRVATDFITILPRLL